MALYPIIERMYDIGRIRSVGKPGPGKLHFTCTDSDECVLKERKSARGLENEYLLHKILNKAAIPVEAIVRTVDEQLSIEYKETRYVMYSAVPGTAVADPCADGNGPFLSLAGETVGRIHRALETCEFDQATGTDPVADMITRGRQELEKVFREPKLMQLTDIITGFFQENRGGLPQQLILENPSFDNILMNRTELGGIINLGQAVYGYRLWDICRLAGRLLYDLIEHNRDRDTWVQLARTLLAGYERAVSLTEGERKSLPFMLYLVQLTVAVAEIRNQRRKYAVRHIDMLKYLVGNAGKLAVPGPADG